MTVLVLSDVHANLPALEAVLAAEEEWDEVIFLGDAVDCGPHPDAVITSLAALDGVFLTGNHDRLVLDADPRTEARSSASLRRQWTKRQLSRSTVKRLEEFRETHRVEREELSLRLHHGNFAPPPAVDFEWRTRLHPEHRDAVFETLAARYPEPYVLHGHSHIPFRKTVDGTTFVNPGSVGLQREGWDPSVARYAVLRDGEISLRETPYDVSSVRDATAGLSLPQSHIDTWLANFDEDENR